MKSKYIKLLVLLLVVVIIVLVDGKLIEKNRPVEEIKMKTDIDKMGRSDKRDIYLAGGCFWGVEGYFQKLNGVLETEVGYVNGKSDKTTYEQVGDTGHAEALHLVYDGNKISLEEILDHYFRIIDPTLLNRQGNDIGTQYRTGIYSDDKEVLEIARDTIARKQEEYNEPIVVEVEEVENYVKGEDYHQDYLRKNPGGYCHIDLGLADVPLYREYSTMTEEEKQSKLSDDAYHITQEDGTEVPGSSEYDQFDGEGIYVDITTGEPLFSSRDKYDAGCGWPSFTRPITSYTVDYQEDTSLGRHRTEVRSTTGDAHLGHVFEDGPEDDGGLRYCINGVALEFIPYEEMDEKGYREYMKYVK